ncbi:MAG: hypothetical protein AAF589_08415 [Planctomycetota bacterium]
MRDARGREAREAEIMAAAGKLRYLYLAFLSKPREDRQLFRLAKRLRATKVVELGIGSLERTLNLISVCQRYSPGEVVSYTGLDWFEERPADQEPLSLIETHRRVTAADAEARLMPGGPSQALPAVANSLLGSDLVLMSVGADEATSADGWFYLPRILKASTVVLQAEERDEQVTSWRETPHSEVESRSKAAAATRLAA